jgi:hypothetical protein
VSKKSAFYVDSVAALWMCKTYRMKFFVGTFCLQPESVDAFFNMLASGIKPEQFVVSAESLPVLEPKLGDVVEEIANGKTKVKRLAAKDFPLSGSEYKILQRGSLPFFVPNKAGE